ncbi:MAG: AAA family ATPase, partial [Bacteroidota bacterium]
MKKTVCLIGPSGVGKSFYAKLLVKELDFARPKTITTRKARPDDDNHIYVSSEEFQGMIRNRKLLEWDEYSGNYYGIMLDEFRNLLLDENNNGVVMDLTLNGCRQVMELYGEVMVIALLPDD